MHPELWGPGVWHVLFACAWNAPDTQFRPLPLLQEMLDLAGARSSRPRTTFAHGDAPAGMVQPKTSGKFEPSTTSRTWSTGPSRARRCAVVSCRSRPWSGSPALRAARRSSTRCSWRTRSSSSPSTPRSAACTTSTGACAVVNALLPPSAAAAHLPAVDDAGVVASPAAPARPRPASRARRRGHQTFQHAAHRLVVDQVAARSRPAALDRVHRSSGSTWPRRRCPPTSARARACASPCSLAARRGSSTDDGSMLRSSSAIWATAVGPVEGLRLADGKEPGAWPAQYRRPKAPYDRMHRARRAAAARSAHRAPVVSTPPSRCEPAGRARAGPPFFSFFFFSGVLLKAESCGKK